MRTRRRRRRRWRRGRSQGWPTRTTATSPTPRRRGRAAGRACRRAGWRRWRSGGLTRRGPAPVHQHAGGGDAVLDRGVEPFEVGQEAVEEREAERVVAVDGRQVVLRVREARVVDAQGAEARGVAAVAGDLEAQLQVSAL